MTILLFCRFYSGVFFDAVHSVVGHAYFFHILENIFSNEHNIKKYSKHKIRSFNIFDYSAFTTPNKSNNSSHERWICDEIFSSILLCWERWNSEILHSSYPNHHLSWCGNKPLSSHILENTYGMHNSLCFFGVSNL